MHEESTGEYLGNLAEISLHVIQKQKPLFFLKESINLTIKKCKKTSVVKKINHK